jgi:flagellar basal body-associated protein FliL
MKCQVFWGIIIIIIIIIIIVVVVVVVVVVVAFSHSGNSPYTSTDKTNKNKYT